MTRVAVLGAGSWGTAFAAVVCDAGADVVLWARRPEVVEAINGRHENPDYLPGVCLPPVLRATADPQEALAGADIVVLAVPSQSLRENLRAWGTDIPRQAVVVSLLKGIELGTARRMSEVVCEVAGVPPQRVAVLSGPNLAKEIAAKMPAASVVACSDLEVARGLQKVFFAPYFRPYTNHDVVGCELGGAVKNVIALAVGMALGLGFGDNARASVITRGLMETARLGAVFGADPLTLSGLAGLGDLVATCSSPLSRNRTFGENLGRGMSVEQVVAITQQTAEGVKSCLPLLEMARSHGVDMPITAEVVKVVHEGERPQDMVVNLISRETKHEQEGLR